MSARRLGRLGVAAAAAAAGTALMAGATAAAGSSLSPAGDGRRAALCAAAPEASSDASSGSATDGCVSGGAREREGFWAQRWEGYKASGRRPGFHRPEINGDLAAHGSEILSGSSNKILVPLCGKTLDLLYLAQSGSVAGVEVVQQAIDEFTEENKLTWVKKEKLDTPGAEVFRTTVHGNPLTIARCDFFSLPKGWSGEDGKFSACWDRAALVAIQPELREAYADVLCEELADNGKILLSTLEYDQEKMNGPPFSASLSQVRDLFEPRGFRLDVLDRQDVLDLNPRMKNAGVDKLTKYVILLTRL